MSGFETEEQIDNLLDAYTKADKNQQVSLLEKIINKELEAFLSRESNDNNATNEVFDFLRYLLDSVHKELD